MDLRCKGAAALKLFTEAPSSGRPDVMWTEGFPVCVCGGEYMKSPLPVLMQKYLAICIKKSIYVNTFYCIIIILYMHISPWI